MNPQTIRKLDVWFGKPLCFALTLARGVGALIPRRRTAAPVRKILLIKMIEQGATVLAYRAIERAVQMVGRENVYFWVFEDNRSILDLLNLIPPENVLALRAKSPLTFARDIIRTLWRIRKLGIDATVDMEFFARASAALAYLTGASRRVGLHRFTSEGPYRGDLMTHRIQYNPYLHTAAGYYLLVEALQSNPAERPMPKVAVPDVDFSPEPFTATAEETAEVRRIVSELASRDWTGPLVLLNPNASDLLPLRRWEPARFVELGRRLLQADPQTLVAITGAPSERAAAEELTQMVGPRAICLAGKTTLRQLVVLYTIADLLVTNDSGPGHFASLTDLPTLVLFGPETPALYAPLGPATQVISANLACSPCVNAMNHRFSPCTNNVCMQSISPQQVWSKVLEMLERGRTGPQSPLRLTVVPRARQWTPHASPRGGQDARA